MSSLSQASRLADLPSAHDAFQGHAAHRIEWSICLGPRTQRVPVYPQVLPHSSRLLHGAARAPTTLPHPTLPWSIELSSGVSPSLLPHCSSHLQRTLPCSAWKTQAERYRWRVHLLAPSALCGSPGFAQRGGQVDLCDHGTAIRGGVPWSFLSPLVDDFRLDWLTEQTRSGRGSLPRRA